jgi:hypothetical protein
VLAVGSEPCHLAHDALTGRTAPGDLYKDCAELRFGILSCRARRALARCRRTAGAYDEGCPECAIFVTVECGVWAVMQHRVVWTTERVEPACIDIMISGASGPGVPR